ncbi:hypothetical protein [Pilimelia columellifera]|uniref:Uncharacterized protein n=1 Tax=Pilimelia columellifera subsp. columellifera TaxID=706583 RepID=A0ABN3NQ12_9ACTN
MASNNHCRFSVGQGDPRQFWVAGFTQRRVLLEGWSYTPLANRYEMANSSVPTRCRARTHRCCRPNDAPFTAPPVATVGRLRARYGVRWLVVDIRRPHDPTGIARVAELRLATGQVSIYRLR